MYEKKTWPNLVKKISIKSRNLDKLWDSFSQAGFSGRQGVSLLFYFFAPLFL